MTIRFLHYIAALALLMTASPLLSAESLDCLGCHGVKGSGAPAVSADLFKSSPHGEMGCELCHSDVTEYPHPKKVEKVDCTMCHSDEAQAFSTSFHAAFIGNKKDPKSACVSCHGFHDIPNPKLSADTICSKCHPKEDEIYRASVHGQAIAGKDEEAATCTSCHWTNHDILPVNDPKSSVYHLNLPRTCGKCHGDEKLAKKHNIPVENAYQLYMDSIHGRAVMKSGLLVAANCSDCHGSHDIKGHADPTSKVSRDHVVETCGKCHVGVEETFKNSIHGMLYTSGAGIGPVCTDCHVGHDITMAETDSWKLQIVKNCGNCHEEAIESYRHSYHGKVTTLGYTQAARCSDCHGSHNILPASNIDSTLNEKNLLATCQNCHADAAPLFVGYLPHANYKDKDKYPNLYYVYIGFTSLLSVTFGFWWLHSLLWGIRGALEKKKNKFKQAIHKKVEGATKFYWRFNLYHRVTHGLIIVSFLGLTATGVPLKFSDRPWAETLAHLFGGFHSMGLIHRFCAIITMIYAAMHLGYLAYRVFKKKDYSILWGPNSLVPNLTDAQQIIAHMKWFVGLGPKPRFGKWSYWEKFDYWAVFWGVAVIGGSGLTLWFPTFFTKFMPGWLLNVATIVHSDEALLAFGFIFTIHFFNNHLRPEKFPMDRVIFTGRMSEEELEHDKIDHFEEMQASGELSQIEARPPEEWLVNFAKLFGYSAIVIGLALILLIALVY